jgi:hypothetical protein
MFGFRFEDDDEAYQFYETIMVRTKARRKSLLPDRCVPHLITRHRFLISQLS